MVVRFSEEDKATIWEMHEAGGPVKQIAKHLGRQNSSLRKLTLPTPGRSPRLGPDDRPSLIAVAGAAATGPAQVGDLLRITDSGAPRSVTEPRQIAGYACVLDKFAALSLRQLGRYVGAASERALKARHRAEAVWRTLRR